MNGDAVVAPTAAPERCRNGGTRWISGNPVAGPDTHRIEGTNHVEMPEAAVASVEQQV